MNEKSSVESSEVGLKEPTSSNIKENNDDSAENNQKNGEEMIANTMSSGEIKKAKLRIWRNVIILSMSYMLLFLAYGVVATLQSSVNNEGGLGTIAEAAVYGTQIFSSLFIPTWIIRKIGLKWTMVVSQLSYAAYTAVQFYPTFYTLIPAAVLLGLGAAPLWTAQSVYLTQIGERYADILGDPKTKEIHISRLFGVFYMIISASSIFGQLLSSLVLSSGGETNATEISEERFSNCGADFCPQEWLNYTNSLTSNEAESENSDSKPENLDALIWILLGCTLAAAIVLAVFIDAPSKKSEEEKEASKLSTWKSVTATLRHIKHPYMMLLIPLTLWTGFKSAFTIAEFTYAFISCALGVDQIGYVLICYGVATTIGSILAGFMVKFVGRIPVILFGNLTNLILIFVMLYVWIPDPDHVEIFYIISALTGLADAASGTQLTSFFGVIFPEDKEAAFSNQRLWKSIAYTIAFSYSNFLCVDVKLYILMSVLVSGSVGYIVIEILEYKKSKKESKSVSHSETSKTNDKA